MISNLTVISKLTVGEPVARDDGRFYVPISHDEPTTLSPIVCRVASDAFPSLMMAKAFAEALVKAYNFTDDLGKAYGKPNG